MAKRIIFFDIKDNEENFFEKYKIHDWEQVYNEDSLTKFSKLTPEDKQAEVISVFTTSRIDAEVLAHFSHLRLIAARSVGFSHIDLDYCKKHNIEVLNAPHYGDNTVAEFTFGLMLDVARHITRAYYDVRSDNINLDHYRGTELYNKTLGIIGLGAIGGEVARIARGFHMNVLAYDIYENDEFKAKYSVKYTTLDEIAEKSDVITIHAPSTKDNYHLIGKEFFSKMKSSAYLVNTARGEIVDTEALYNALVNKKILGAGLDVLEYEEILHEQDEYISKINNIDAETLRKNFINNNLLKLKNVVVTPHIAFNTKEAVNRTLEITHANISKFIGSLK